MLQAFKRRKSKKGKDDEDDDEEFLPPHLEKKTKVPRYTYNSGTRQRVTEKTAHKKKNFNKTKYKAVYTCLNCGRPLAYHDLSGSFQENQYAYTSGNDNKHDGTALAMDHYPQWAGRYHQHVKSKSSLEEMKKDFRDESKLRALCKVCNESHLLEHDDLPDDYDSDKDGSRDPGTPSDESDNKGRWSSFWDPGSGKGGGGIKT